MSADWSWPGSRWWRVDLHAHSPASYDFKPEDRDAQDWAACWVSAEKDAGLHAVAVTDHNSAQGIDAIRQAAAEIEDAPVLFPGVEITANDGTHLLFVLDPARCRQEHVEDLLAKAAVPVDTRGRKEARSKLSVENLLDLDFEHGIILGAHVNKTAGLLEHSGQQRLCELRHPRLAGVEIDPCAPPFDSSWLDDHPEIGRVIPQVWCSDSHSFSEAGERFTWVKMTKPSIEGLRLALLDGAASLQPATREEPGNPNRHADCVIESITVKNAKYMGRSGPLTVALNPWLNALIGGRGTGKSSLVDFCRVVLRREKELQGSGESSLGAVFEKRMRIPGNRRDEGLLTEETTVEVIYRKDGERFVLSWDPKGETQPISRLEGDGRLSEVGDIRERFPVRIYSQKQLFDLAREPNALLTFIDDSAQVRGAELERLLREAEAQYLAQSAEARALHVQASDLSARTSLLTDVRRNLELLLQGGHAKALNEYRARRRQDGTWESIVDTAIQAVDAVGQSADGNLAVADLDLDPESEGDTATAALRRAHERMRTTVDNLRKTVLDAVERARTEIYGVRAGDDVAQWREAVGASETAYQEVTRQLAEAGIANPEEYRDLLQRSTTLEQEIVRLEKQRKRASEREKEAAATLQRYRELRSELTKRRRELTEKIPSELIKVEIHGYGRHENLEELLRNALSIPRFEEDYRALVENLVPPTGQPWSFESLDRLTTQLREMIANPNKQWELKDRRFLMALRKLQPERIDRVTLILPDDAVEVSFRDPRDGNGRWRGLSQGSPGQQTAALLAFVLGDGHEPILLDQPEDDLDNTLIYELLVKRLRETKSSRQVIVVTHNPNIVVHGDAEYVVSLEVRGGQTWIAFEGGLQEEKARDEICRVMEGGRDAFEARYHRIMLPGDRRDG